MPFDKQALIGLVQREAVTFGDFTLASGRKSHVYIDCRLLTLTAGGLAVIADGMAGLLAGVDCDAVGGPTLGADPIVGAVLHRLGVAGAAMRGFLVRKEAKTHGAGRLVEGPMRRGDRVVLLEDVATSGGSLLKAIDAVEAAGATVVLCATVLDRLQGAAAAFAGRGVAFKTLLTVDDLDLTQR